MRFRVHFSRVTLDLLAVVAAKYLGVHRNNLRRLLRTVEALTDLGPELTAERDFAQTARLMLVALMEAAAAREGALFTFSDKPSLLASVARKVSRCFLNRRSFRSYRDIRMRSLLRELPLC